MGGESKLRGVWEWGQVGQQVVPAILVQLRCAAPVGGPEGGQSRERGHGSGVRDKLGGLVAGVVLVEVPNPDVVVNHGSDGVMVPIDVKRVVWVDLLGAREDKKPGGGITTRDPGRGLLAEDGDGLGLGGP